MIKRIIVVLLSCLYFSSCNDHKKCKSFNYTDINIDSSLIFKCRSYKNANSEISLNIYRINYTIMDSTFSNSYNSNGDCSNGVSVYYKDDLDIQLLQIHYYLTNNQYEIEYVFDNNLKFIYKNVKNINQIDTLFNINMRRGDRIYNKIIIENGLIKNIEANSIFYEISDSYNCPIETNIINISQ